MTKKNRFYPDFILPFVNEPTKQNFQIKEMDTVGKGIVSLAGFYKGDEVCRFTGMLTDKRDRTTLEHSSKTHLDDPWFMAFAMHSCDPTVKINMEDRALIAAKDIKVGDLVSFDYTTTESKLAYPFLCHCGSGQCKGIIKGWAE